MSTTATCASSSASSDRPPGETDFVVSYGTMRDFGRFRSSVPISCVRGDRAVVVTPRGVEIGEVLRPTTDGHARFLPNTSVGRFLRLATSEDEQQAEWFQLRTASVCDTAAARAAELGLPLAVLDAEMLLDGEHVVLHVVRWEECDIRDLVSDLSRRFEATLTIQDLTHVPEPEEAHGCGNCGSEGGGGCGDCGSGGCGSCGVKDRTHFAELREKMETTGRMPLLM